ncbi:MAG TPA: hypothetical protein VEZ90_18940, partial [Blastocatellia bacterium]|nr:hypothetical protein [Blastocatellia bacterium]
MGRALSERAAKNPARLAARAAKEAAGTLEESAGRTSPYWNKVGAISAGVGKATIVVGVGISAYNIATAENKDEAAMREAGAWGGALAGGAGGAKVGAAIGTMVEPGGGTAVGAGAGGILGAIGGALCRERGRA